MSISSFQTTTSKQRVQIVTVDPERRVIQAALKDNAIIFVAVWDIPTFFRWPKEGEIWSVIYENGMPRLGDYVEQDDAPEQIETLLPGQARIDADLVKFSGQARVRGNLIVEGIPSGPTAPVDTSTDQFATTAFVTGQGYLKSAAAGTTYQPLDPDLTSVAAQTGTGFLTRTAASVWTTRTVTGTTDLTVTNGDGALGNPTLAVAATVARLASPAFSGIPTAPTAAVDTSSVQIASTAFVINQGYLKSSDAANTYLTQSNAAATYQPLDPDLTNIAGQTGAGFLTRTAVNSWTTRTILGTTDLTVANGDGIGGNPTLTVAATVARLASPAFTGTPTSTTAAVDTSSTQIATTAFVINQAYLKASTAATTYQPLDPDLTNIAGQTGAGFLTRTAVNTWTTRTILGSTDLTVANGDGIGGNPTLTVAATIARLANPSFTTEIFVAGNVALSATGAFVQRNATALGTTVWATRATASTVDAHSVLADGLHSWGSGTTTLDTNLYRSAADTLATDDTFNAGLNVRARFGAVTQVSIGDIGAAGAGLSFGSAGDTNLYRSAANTLKTDDDFHGAGFLFAYQGNVEQVRLGPTGPGPGVLFGSAGDTNLYRQGAGILKTSSHFEISTTGSTKPSPKRLTFTDGGAATAWRISGPGDFDGIQTGTDQRLTIGAYWGIHIRGNSQTELNTIGFTTGALADPSVSVIGTVAGSAVLSVVGVTGQTASLQQWVNGAGSVLTELNANGSLVLQGANIYGFGTGNSIRLGTDRGLYVGGGSQPATVATAGTAADQALQAFGVKGGNTTGTTGQLAGQGGQVSIIAGDGGNAPAGSTNGSGGNITLQGGGSGTGLGAAGDSGKIRLLSTLHIGTDDTNLYRGGTNLLRTDDGFWANLEIISRRGDLGQVGMGDRGILDGGAATGIAAIVFGQTGDTNLYRNAADLLKTDDDFEIGTIGKGIIIRSPNNTRWRVTVNDAGALTTTAVA